MRRVDCSKFSDPRPRNSCRQVECLFSEQWGRWRERSEAGGVRSPRSALSRRPAGTMELDLAATYEPPSNRYVTGIEYKFFLLTYYVFVLRVTDWFKLELSASCSSGQSWGADSLHWRRHRHRRLQLGNYRRQCVHFTLIFSAFWTPSPEFLGKHLTKRCYMFGSELGLKNELPKFGVLLQKIGP